MFTAPVEVCWREFGFFMPAFSQMMTAYTYSYVVKSLKLTNHNLSALPQPCQMKTGSLEREGNQHCSSITRRSHKDRRVSHLSAGAGKPPVLELQGDWHMHVLEKRSNLQQVFWVRAHGTQKGRGHKVWGVSWSYDKLKATWQQQQQHQQGGVCISVQMLSSAACSRGTHFEPTGAQKDDFAS